MQQVYRTDEGWVLKSRVNGYPFTSKLKARSEAGAHKEAEQIRNRWKQRLKNLYLRGNKWYCTALVHGRRISKCVDCDTPDWPIARQRARALILAVRADKWSILTDLSSRPSSTDKIPTIQQCIDIYERRAVANSLRPRTWKAYISSLRLVLGESDLNIPVDRVSRRALKRYVVQQLESRGDTESTRRSIRSTIRQARSIFSRWAMDDYRDAGLKLPDELNGFLECRGCKPAAVHYRLPPAELIERTHQAAKGLRESNVGLWAAYLMTYYFALRAGEAAACRWTWFDVDHNGRRWLRIEAREGEWAGPKGTHGKVPVPDDVWDWLQDIRAVSPVFVLPGDSPTARRNLVGRSFSEWMRSMGWTGPKAAHELRKLRGSEWYTKHGLEVAAAWLRHSDPSVTSRYYADLVQHPEL